MAIQRFGLCISLALLSLGGCTSYNGAERIHTQANYSKGLVDRGFRQAPFALGLSQSFATDLQAAYAARGTPQAAGLNRLMMNSGLALIHANCTEYFHEMGKNHRNSRVLRDLVTPITNVITGLVALHVFSDMEATNTNLLKALAIGSGAYTAGLDIYDNRFLFGSDNIGSVKTLTFKALSSHQASLEQEPPNDFVFVITHLLDNENICTPPQILNLVRQSIGTGTPTTEGPGETGETPPSGGDTNEPESPNVARPVSVEPKGSS